MPFIKPDRRLPAAHFWSGYDEPGDRCFRHYLRLKDAWRLERRWTTAHVEFMKLFRTDQEQTAKILAFLEFYIREVHEYENEKIKENGDI